MATYREPLIYVFDNETQLQSSGTSKVRNDARIDDKGAGRGPIYPHDQPKHGRVDHHPTSTTTCRPLHFVSSAPAQRSGRGGPVPLLEYARAKLCYANYTQYSPRTIISPTRKRQARTLCWSSRAGVPSMQHVEGATNIVSVLLRYAADRLAHSPWQVYDGKASAGEICTSLPCA